MDGLHTVLNLKRQFIAEKGLEIGTDKVNVKKTGFGYHVFAVVNGIKYGRFYKI